MFLFNLKNNVDTIVKKKKKTNEKKTLDYKHFEMVQYFENIKKNLDDKKKLLIQSEQDIQDLNYDYINCIDNNQEKGKIYLEIKKTQYLIDDLKKDINKIENCYEEKEYYNRVDHILFQYYSFFESNHHLSNKKINDININNGTNNEINCNYGMNDENDIDGEMSSNEEDNSDLDDEENIDCDIDVDVDNEIDIDADVDNDVDVDVDVDVDNDMNDADCIDIYIHNKNSKNQSNVEQKKDILYFFGIKNNEQTIIDNNYKTDNKFENKNIQKSELHNQYIHEITKYYQPEIKRVNHTLCPDCKVEREILLNEGKYYCPLCCGIDRLIVDSDRPSYKEPPPEVSYFAYKRINHFNQWLNQFQAKETSDIPIDVYDMIILELKKEKNMNLKKLKKKKMKEIMKKLGLTRYYENISHIIYKINGIHPPQIPAELEETLRNMFRNIQGPFMRSCAKIQKKRKNFLSYSYVLYKFLELLGFDNLKLQFPLLKCREKLHKQDKIWQGICMELGWHFISSI